jgi:phage gp29-like protein
MTTILNQFGEPFKQEDKAQLQEPQTARLVQLRYEFENHPSRGLTPPRLAKILQDAEQGDLTAQHELFADMEEKDGHLFSELQKRRLAVQQLDWSIVPPHNASAEEKKHAEFVAEVLKSMEDFGDVLFDMTDAIGHGFAPLEMTWGRVDGVLMPTKIEHRPQGWFKLALDPAIGRNELRLRDNTVDGERLWQFGWIMHQHRARSGYVSRSGLFRVLTWPFIFKNYAVRDLAEFLEIYGLPIRLGTYNVSATKEDKATLLRAVAGIGHNAAAIIPSGMAIEFKDAASGDNKAFDSMISLMERTMSKAILGGTLTSGEGEHGTQALGKVHNEVRTELRNGDAKQIAATLKRQLIYPLLALNKGLSDVRRCPSLVFDTQQPEDLKLFSEALPVFVDMGMRVKRSWAHDKLKIPEAAEGDEVLTPAAAKPTQPADPKAKPPSPGSARLKAQLPGDVAGDELDDLADEMLGDWQEVLGETLQPIQAALAAASTLEEFRDALEVTLSQAESGKLAELLARGQFAARAWGQLHQVKKAS